MKIILNSDILHNEQLVIDNVSKRLQKLFRACAEMEHVIVIPLTALLEFSGKQSEFVGSSISKLEDAYSLLAKFKIPYTRVEPREVVKQPDLIKLIQKTGVAVMVEDPTKEDFKEAHKRTCLHECPHPPDAKAHEMRDLVIWMIALRLASQDGGALLISQDKVHVHSRGDDEAASVRLVRVKNVEEALEYLNMETPAGKLIKQLLAPAWNDLVDAGLPVTSQMSLISISQARFVQGSRGPSFAYCILKARTSDGKTLKATTEVNATDGIITDIIFSDILVDDEPWTGAPLTITPHKTFTAEQDDHAERLRALKAILGG